MGRATVVVALALVAASCGGGDGGDGETAVPASASTSPVPSTATVAVAGTTTEASSAPNDPTSDLECERLGYPCSLADVPVEVLRRSDELAEEANRRLDDGGSMADVATWLAELDDVAEVESDEGAVRFRVDGGRGTWLLGEGLTDTRSVPPTTPPAAASVASSAARPVRRPATRTSPRHVVGPGEPAKRALVLAPVLYQFGDVDDAPVVAGLLAEVDDYAGGVSYRSNPSRTSTGVTLADFEGWDAFDVVHVSTHGKRICVDEPCRGMIVAGPLDPLLPSGAEYDVDEIAGLDLLDRPGVGIAIGRSGDGYVILTADFFRATYGSGLSDTFVFFNACQTLGGGQTDLAEAISGSTSVFVGWSDVVESSDAIEAATALYGEMADRGVTADDAYDSLDASAITGATTPGYGPPVLELRDRSDGDHLRIREVVELVHAGTTEPIEPFDEIAIVGTIDDGEPDSVPYHVHVEGHDELQAGGAVLHVSVDGIEAEPRLVDEGVADGAGGWVLDGLVDLGADLTEERDARMRAWVELPDGGESSDAEDVTLVGEPVMGTRWEMVATHQAVFTNLPATPATETATITFVFAPGQERDEAKPRYVIEGGSVTVDQNHTYSDCTYSADVFTFDPAGDEFSYLEFDTTATPVTYTGYVLTRSPEFTVIDDCGEGPSPRSHRVVTQWFDLRGSWESVVDRATIQGTHELPTGDFYLQTTEYTIRRID